MGPSPPPNALGAELIWWREDGHRHTLLTIAAPLFAERIGARSVQLTFALFGVGGRFVMSWERELGAEETIFVDSREVRARALPEAPALPEEGVLVVWVCAPDAPHPELYARALAMVDWFSEAGDLASLHTDQSLAPGQSDIELTEMVVVETASSRAALVIVNGPEAQPAGGLDLVLRNHRGEQRAVIYREPMAPFTVNKVVLRDLVSDLLAFGADREISISGFFSAHGIFTRPYVVTEGERPSAYHGGNRYPAASIPRLVHQTFPYAEAERPVPRELMLVTGQQQMNPAYVVHGSSLTTRVHLFQSHGDLEESFFVDATLYDTNGRVVAHRERWAVAPRRGASTCEIAELTAGLPFEGHLALRFSDDDKKEAFPQRLQALLEYRTGVSIARVMLWSDRWNAPDRMLDQRLDRALYRVFSRGPRRSTLAITNPGVGGDYDREAPYVIRLRNARGEELVHRGTLRPHATMVASIDALFPERAEDELALAIVESPFDLASIHLTEDPRSGVVSAEHLLAVRERDRVPCGA